MSDQKANTPVLVIGYGNELRGDDGLGPELARAVAALGRPGVRAVTVHQLTPELAETLAGVCMVVFVDAAVPSAAESIQVRRVEPGVSAGGLSHSGDPRGLVVLARDLYGHAPEAWWVTVAGKDFRLGQGLSDEARALVRETLRRVEILISD
jgi:hydrogenase maturation protease